MRALLAAGADAHLQAQVGRFLTALCAAQKNGHRDIEQLLLKAGVRTRSPSPACTVIASRSIMSAHSRSIRTWRPLMRIESKLSGSMKPSNGLPTMTSSRRSVFGALCVETPDVSLRKSPVVATAAHAAESESDTCRPGGSRSYLTFKWNKGILHSYVK